MADCSATMILIGGPVPHALKADLLEALATEDLSIDGWDNEERTSDLSSAEAYLEGCNRDRVPAQFADSMARGGQFEDLEAFLTEHRIAFRRFDSGHYTWAPSLRVFDPERGFDTEVISDQEGRALAYADLLLHWQVEYGLDVNGCAERLRTYEECPPFAWTGVPPTESVEPRRVHGSPMDATETA